MIELRIDKNDKLPREVYGVYVNEVSVGDIKVSGKWLFWTSNPNVRNVKFQFGNENTFFEVVDGLKKYKDDNGLKYLVVSSFDEGYVMKIGKDWIAKAGFFNIYNEDPHYFFLE